MKKLTGKETKKSIMIADKVGNNLTEEDKILGRWTEYCSELSNQGTEGDQTILQSPDQPEEPLLPILRDEIVDAVKSLKIGKAPGVDNVAAKLLIAGGDPVIDVLHKLCNHTWRTGEWPTSWTKSLILTIPKKGSIKECGNHRTISLISHASKVMLPVILNRLQPQVEHIISEEHSMCTP